MAVTLLPATLSAPPALAAAAAPRVSMRISAGYAKRTLTRCGDRSPYTYVHRGGRVLIQGAVRPRPSARSWHVTIRRKLCVGTKWQGNLGDIGVAGRSDGSFRTSYTALRRGIFSVHIIYDIGGVRVKSATYHLVVR